MNHVNLRYLRSIFFQTTESVRIRRNTPYAIRNTPYAIRPTQYALRNTQYAIRNTEYGIPHFTSKIANVSRDTHTSRSCSS